MPARIDLPDELIVRLVDDEGMSFSEVKKTLELDCHVDTIRRHYKLYEPEKEPYTEYYTRLDVDTIKPIEIEEEPSIWQRIKDWFSNLF